MKKAIRVLEVLYETILVIMTAIIVLLGVYQVVGRNLSFIDTSWTEEAMRYIYVGIIMLGLGCVAKEESFTTITVVSDIVNRHSKIGGMILYCLKNFAQILCFVLIFWFGLQLALSAGNRVAATTRVTFDIIYAPIPIGSFLGALYSILKMVERFRIGKKNAERGEIHE